MNETHYPECVSFVFWEKLQLDNFVSRLTDLYKTWIFSKYAWNLKSNLGTVCSVTRKGRDRIWTSSTPKRLVGCTRPSGTRYSSMVSMKRPVLSNVLILIFFFPKKWTGLSQVLMTSVHENHGNLHWTTNNISILNFRSLNWPSLIIVTIKSLWSLSPIFPTN